MINRATATAGITGIRVLYLGTVLAAVVGLADEKRDEVLLVEYPNFAAFRGVVESPC